MPNRATDRHYLEVEPATDPIGPEQLTTAFKRLHGVRDDPQLEALLTATADGVAYYIGTDATRHTAVDSAVRQLFPDDTTITTPDTQPLDELDFEPPDPVDAADTPPTAAVQFYGRGQRRDDWQTRLPPPGHGPPPDHGSPAEPFDDRSPGPHPPAEPVTATGDSQLQFPLAMAVDPLPPNAKDRGKLRKEHSPPRTVCRC